MRRRRPRALDLFCCAGGASKGLVDAGFDVTGVDIAPQPEYPFHFVHADAMTYPLAGFDFIWASPPCQHHTHVARSRHTTRYPDLIPGTRERLYDNLLKHGVPYVIENVPGAQRQLVSPIMLCGVMFGLGVLRHRFFETSFNLHPAPFHPEHEGSLLTGEYVTVTGKGGVPSWTYKKRMRLGLPKYFDGEMSIERWRAAMGINWMSREALVQAIPPAYAEFIGQAARAVLR